MKLYAYNPTKHPRYRWCVFGAPPDVTPPPEVVLLERLPESLVCAARVRVPAHTSGEVEILVPPADYLTPATTFSIANGLFRPTLFGVEPEGIRLLPASPVYDGPHFKRLRWEAHVPGKLHAFLWTDLGAGDSVAPFELRVYFEDLHLGRIAVPHLSFGNGLAPIKSFVSTHTWFAKDGVLASSTEFADGMGIGFRGAFLFFYQEDDLETLQAETVWPLDVLTVWERFGGWKKPTKVVSYQDFVQLAAYAQQNPFSDPLSDCGAMHPPDAARTGEHEGFGTQGMEYPAIVGDPARGCAMLFAASQQAARQSCRPVHFFSDAGVPLVPAKDLVTWMEVAHYSPVVSPNRMGRHDETGLYRPHVRLWLGQDREHSGCMHVYEDAIVRGSEASRYELEWKAKHWICGHTLPSTHPGWSTNGGGNGRARGRELLGACLQFLATGSHEILEHMRKALIETMLSFPLEKGPGDYYADTIYRGDVRVFEGQPGHVCWEDAILVTGYDIAQRIVRAHLFDSSLADQILERCLLLTDSLVKHCFFPAALWPQGAHLAYHILWRDGNPPQGDEWLNPDIVNPSIPGTGVTKWAHGALQIAVREQTPMAARAAELLQQLGDWGWYMRRHEGVA